MKVRLVRASRSDYAKIKQLYRKAFPPEEQAPFWLLRWKAHQRIVDFWSVYADVHWAGLLYIVNDNDLSYIFYFAVSEEIRGKGIGSAALQTAVQKYTGRRLFLAIEEIDKAASNYAERVRRKAFYERNGFVKQPGRLQEAQDMSEVLGVGGRVRPEEYKHLMQTYMGFRAKFIKFEMTE